MHTLKHFLCACFEDVQRLVILGVGSELKADDAAGSEIANHFIGKYSEICSVSLRVYNGSTAPENYAGIIKNFEPSHIMIIDAADIGEEPGCVSVIEHEAVSGVSFSTHMLPLKIMSEYILAENACEIIIIGIQPSDLSFGAPMTLPVKKTVSQITNILEELLHKNRML